MTNLDYIRSLPAEELARIIAKSRNCDTCCAFRWEDGGYDRCSTQGCKRETEKRVRWEDGSVITGELRYRGGDGEDEHDRAEVSEEGVIWTTIKKCSTQRADLA